ncbi:hypothetical protein ABVK25_001946 [Lepraria finkii]|uniref:DNA2/NAM7 helicase-like C-terminal domain-containing protein n=1 Tax=Lepraria finkii TaxID=1340010 RepID=A0ABR4BIA4_9LECA
MSNKYKVYHDIDARCLGQQDVIGMTTTACAMNWPTLSQIGLPVVICEEAGEVMEAQSLCTLFPSVEHAIFIGDPFQLRPQVKEPALSLETELGAHYRLDESLMERMMLPSTASTLPISSSRLNIQRRMHPEIADIMRPTLYPYLEDHESTHDRDAGPVMADRVWWLDHQAPEDVEMVVGLVEHLVNTNEYDFKDITILPPYNGQLAAFKERLSSTCSLWLSEKDRESLNGDGLLDPEEIHLGGKTGVQISTMLELATIDNFQGEESRTIILSTVQSNPEGRVGFLARPKSHQRGMQSRKRRVLHRHAASDCGRSIR